MFKPFERHTFIVSSDLHVLSYGNFVSFQEIYRSYNLLAGQLIFIVNVEYDALELSNKIIVVQ